MKRRILHYTLGVCLLLSTVFAAWNWLRPYDWHPDPAARATVIETLLTPDQSYSWVNVHLKLLPGASHDLRQPVFLHTASGTDLAPADTTFAGTDGAPPDEIWLRFWLPAADLAGPLLLHLNGGRLTVKSTAAPPDLGGDIYRNFTTHRW